MINNKNNYFLKIHLRVKIIIIKIIIFIKMNPKIFFILYYLIQFSQEKLGQKKGIFDETKLKNLKLKNRIFKGSIIDCSFIDGHITEEGLKIYEKLAQNEIGTIFTGTAVVSDYNAFQDNPEFRMDKDEYI